MPGFLLFKLEHFVEGIGRGDVPYGEFASSNVGVYRLIVKIGECDRAFSVPKSNSSVHIGALFPIRKKVD